ncbi:cell envelope protein SmpA [Variovorax sp. J22R133]|uniref:cell envelope protein SmpA n=1 Tax=Variovorax brevis TaxID=3053503 RepID=UPI002578D2F8|nr:cell envelope protein SmpA [Variovorax sp. J22R133]MDM0113365.1 cell envelope protein SmpA [Variovorax sp. J22R133]
MLRRLAMVATFASLAMSAAHAQRPTPPQGPLIQGYLCCNLRTTGKKITDINYDESGKSMLPLGTPVSITSYDFRSVEIDVKGKGTQRLMNDYSRDLKAAPFAQRYVLKDDPKLKLATFSEATRQAIEAAKVIPGMTREQVVMSVGYPVTSENPDFNAKVWRFWLDSWTEFQVVFDDSNVVKSVVADEKTLSRVTPGE